MEKTIRVIILLIAICIAYKYVDPAPPNRIVISTSEGEGDYLDYAKQYKEIIEKSGVKLDIRESNGARENLKRLKDPKSDVDVAFVQDGLETKDSPVELVSLGSLYYEPLWIF